MSGGQVRWAGQVGKSEGYVRWEGEVGIEVCPSTRQCWGEFLGVKPTACGHCLMLLLMG